MITKALYRCLCCAVALCCGTAMALPPLGFTQIDPALGGVEIIGGTAYIGAPGGVRTVTSAGDLGFIGISHPSLAPLFFTTPVIKASDSELYVGATFGTFNNYLGGALYNLNQPSAPIVSWEGDYRISGVARDLTVFGTDGNVFAQPIIGSRFLLNGTVELLDSPPGERYTRVNSSTPSGFVLGDAFIPGTAGVGPAVWTPAGDFSFLELCCISSSLRDRLDGDGVNIGTDGEVKYGSDALIRMSDQNGSSLGGLNVIVSHSDFAVVLDSGTDLGNFAFYPGIVSSFPDRAMPLLDIFPELATIDIDTIHDLASVDGYLYMTLSGNDGTFLFGARDPSVAIPEPASAAMLLFVTMLCAVPSRGERSHAMA